MRLATRRISLHLHGQEALRYTASHCEGSTMSCPRVGTQASQGGAFGARGLHSNPRAAASGWRSPPNYYLTRSARDCRQTQQIGRRHQYYLTRLPRNIRRFDRQVIRGGCGAALGRTVTRPSLLRPACWAEPRRRGPGQGGEISHSGIAEWHMCSHARGFHKLPVDGWAAAPSSG